MMKLTVVAWLMVLTVLNSTSPADAIGFDLLGQLTDLLFGSDESDESSETVINAKPNANVTVFCEKECNLNVTCINCNKIDTAMMKPPNGNGGGGGNGGSKPTNGGGNGGNGGGNGGGATSTSTDASVPDMPTGTPVPDMTTDVTVG